MTKLGSVLKRNNQGMRYFYLAVQERIAYYPFLEKFNHKDPNTMVLWFKENADKYKLLQDYVEV